MTFEKKNWEFDDTPTEDDANRWEQGIYEVHQDLEAHKEDTNNPHQVTKEQVGLGNVANYDIASKEEAEEGSSSTGFMTPERTKQAIQTLSTSEQVNVISSKGITSDTKLDSFPVGISIMQTVSVNTGFPVDKGTLQTTRIKNNLYYGYQLFVSRGEPQSSWIRQVISSSGEWSEWREIESTKNAQEKVDKHANLKNNPHNVTKSQVGLANVDNIKQATKEEFDESQVHKLTNDNGSHLLKIMSGTLFDALKDYNSATFYYSHEVIDKPGNVSGRGIKMVGQTGISTIFVIDTGNNAFWGYHGAHSTNIEWKTIETPEGAQEKADIMLNQAIEWVKSIGVGTARISLGNFETQNMHINSLDLGHYEGHHGTIELGFPFTGGDVMEIDVTEGAAGGRKQIQILYNYKNTKYFKTIHTDGDDRGWKQVATTDTAQMYKITPDSGNLKFRLDEADSDLDSVDGNLATFYSNKSTKNHPDNTHPFRGLYITDSEPWGEVLAMSNDGNIWRRSKIEGGWRDWKKFSDDNGTGWIDVPTLLNGWETFVRPPKYLKVGNTVHLRGIITGGLFREAAFILPPDCRPTGVHAIPISSISTGSNTSPVNRLEINYSGEVIVSFSIDARAFALEGVSFTIT